MPKKATIASTWSCVHCGVKLNTQYGEHKHHEYLCQGKKNQNLNDGSLENFVGTGQKEKMFLKILKQYDKK